MAAQPRTDDRNGVPESKFYLPAGVSPSSEDSLFERLWAALFNHSVESSR